jgi:predicted N-acetyltransferase YhbS
MLRAGMIRLPLKVGLRGSVRVLNSISATEPFHKQVEGPHWYLLALGTRPERQGQGLGSALMEIGTAQADAAGIPTYLETATDADIAYYGKRGFEVIGQTRVGEFTLSGMVRQPR